MKVGTNDENGIWLGKLRNYPKNVFVQHCVIVIENNKKNVATAAMWHFQIV